MRSTEVPLDDSRWESHGLERRHQHHLGRDCVALSEGPGVVVSPRGVELLDGTIEADVCIEPGRSFHGLAWRVASPDEHESFFLRPHQIGNPDAIQYTPVRNGVSSWQLYHGEGFWNPVRFTIGGWLTLRVAFAGDRAAAWVDGELVLSSRLRLPAGRGGVGLLVGGVGLRLARFAVSDDVPEIPDPPVELPEPRAVTSWLVSDPVAESALPETLDGAFLDALSWVPLEAEAGGLLDLARRHAPSAGADTVLVRHTIHAATGGRVALDLGYSDRAVVFLNGERLYRGDATYRVRDYRFLGSIGWFDTVYLPLAQGANDLVVAVSEDYGGWGVQARLP